MKDTNRDRECDSQIDRGYVRLVKERLGFEETGKYEFVNRGIGGNRIVDVYVRIKNDIINVKPDVMSLLLGVNDVWHELDYEYGVDAEKFYKIYDMLISELKEALPDIRIMLMGPFVLQETATESRGEIFRTEVEKRAAMAKKIAQKYNLPFVELQKGFDELCKRAEPDYWLGDGVHPTTMGHEYIKIEWLKAFKAL